MLLSAFCQVAVCNLKPLDADSAASVRAGLSEVPWSQLATSSTAIRMHLFQPSSQAAKQQEIWGHATASSRQVTHASTSISSGSCGRDLPVWLCKPQRWPPDPTNYSISLCLLLHTYIYIPHPYIRISVSVAWSAGNMRCQVPAGSHQQSTWWRAQ